MDELEIVEGVIDAAEGAEEAAAAVQNVAAEVQDNAAVQQVANAPAIEAGAQNAVQNFIENNPYGQKLWSFAKWLGGAAASASVAFGIMYGLNKAIAKNAHDSGKRLGLSDYLKQVQSNFEKNGLTWNDDVKKAAATDALAFPWIDATQ